MLESQYRRLRRRIAVQAAKIARRVSPRKSLQELTNQDVKLELYACTAPPQADETEEEIEKREVLVNRLMARLDKDEMAVINSRFFEDKTIGQTAKFLQIDRKTVYNRIHSAFTKMRRRKLPSEWIE